MGEDGACMFRAVADQVYGDQEMHGVVRQNCIDYMVSSHGVGVVGSVKKARDIQPVLCRKKAVEDCRSLA